MIWRFRISYNQIVHFTDSIFTNEIKIKLTFVWVLVETINDTSTRVYTDMTIYYLNNLTNEATISLFSSCLRVSSGSLTGWSVLSCTSRQTVTSSCCTGCSASFLTVLIKPVPIYLRSIFSDSGRPSLVRVSAVKSGCQPSCYVAELFTDIDNVVLHVVILR